MRLVISLLFLHLFFVFTNIWGGYPEKHDTALLVSTGISAGALAYFADELTVKKPRIRTVAPGDAYIRKKLLWRSNSSYAKFTSDILFYGIMLPSVLYVPAFASSNYIQGFHALAEVATFNALLVNFAKVVFARARPGLFYSSNSQAGSDQNHSFYSGHTSLSFAMAISASMLFAQRYPRQGSLFYAGALSLAAFTGYLRVAADRHFFSDVLIGALIGSTTAYFLIKYRLNQMNNENSTADTIKFSTVVLRW